MSDDEGDKVLRVAYFGGMAVFLCLAAVLAFFLIGWAEALVALAIAALAFGSRLAVYESSARLKPP